MQMWIGEVEVEVEVGREEEETEEEPGELEGSGAARPQALLSSSLFLLSDGHPLCCPFLALSWMKNGTHIWLPPQASSTTTTSTLAGLEPLKGRRERVPSTSRSRSQSQSQVEPSSSSDLTRSPLRSIPLPSVPSRS